MPPPRGPFSLRPVVLLLVLAGLVPAVLTVSAGIVSLVLWSDASDIVVGVLVISFATMVLGATITTLVVLARFNRLARLQADFVANISHELRTPLTSIRLFAETLRLGRAQTPEEVDGCLQALTVETDRLSALIERALRWRHMESGAAAPPRRPERLEDIVHDALRPLDAQFRAQGTALELSAEGILPPVLADRSGLADAIRNVVHNALQYGGHAGPVEVRLWAKGEERVLVEVRDRGPGIPKGELKQVFDRFFRGDGARGDPRRPGTGLGLAIARHVTRAHGGSVTVESPPGWGTRVCLELPAAPRGLAAAQEAESEETAGSARTAALLSAPSRTVEGEQPSVGAQEQR